MKILNNLLRAIFLLFIVFIPVSASAEIFNTLPDITDSFQSLTKIRDNFYFIGNSLSNISNQTKKQAIEQTTSIINKVEFLQNAYEQGLTDKIQVVMEAVNIIEKNKAGFFDESNEITKQLIPVEEIQSKLAKIFFLWKKQSEEKQESKLKNIENIDNKTIKKEQPINNNEQKENSEQVPVKEKIIERVLEKEILSQQEKQRITNNEQNIKFLIEQINDLKKERAVSFLQKESSSLDEKLLLLEQELQNQIRLSANATTNQVIQVMAPIGNNEGAKKFTVQESIVNQGSFTQQGSATFQNGITVLGNQTFTGDQIISGDLVVNGGDITSNVTIFNFDIGNTGTWNLRDGTNNLISVSDNGTGGILTVNTITPSIINSFTAGGNIDMATNIISNIGNAETNFTASGGLNLASNFIVNTNKLYVDATTGNVGIGTTTPTAVLHLKAGAAAASTAPLKFSSGALNTTAEAGAVEFLTDAYYGTITTGAARKTFAFLESPVFTTSITGSYLTPSEILITDASKNLVSAAVATYPSLAELAYVKGVSSAIQTQMDLKAPLADPIFTGAVTIPTPFTLGATSVTSTGTQLNYLNAAIGTTGTTDTNLVFSTSPALITPDLGTPSALVLTNATGLPAASVLAGTFGTGAYTMDTTLTVPTILGGTATTSDLNLKTTSGIGATGADMHFLVGNNGATEAMTILNSGNVGIGTATPGAKLDIQNSGTNLIRVDTSGFTTIGANTSGRLIVDTNDVQIIGITYSSSPSVLVNDGITSYIKKNNNTNVAVGDTNTIQIGFWTNADVDSTRAFVGMKGVVTDKTATLPDADLVLFSSLNAVKQDVMRITSGGNLGIGTITPTAVLHLKAGAATASTAPLKFSSGALNTTAEAGAVE